MALNNIFSIFLPKDKIFYNLFEQTGKNVADIGKKLKEFVNETDPIKRARIHTEMEDLEHRNDEVTHQIF